MNKKRVYISGAISGEDYTAVLLRIAKSQAVLNESKLLERIIEIFTDKGDVVIDPCAGSGTTLLAAANMKRKAYGFEVNKKFCADAEQKVLKCIHHNLFV